MIEDIRSEIVSDHPGADTQSEVNINIIKYSILITQQYQQFHTIDYLEEQTILTLEHLIQEDLFLPIDLHIVGQAMTLILIMIIDLEGMQVKTIHHLENLILSMEHSLLFKEMKKKWI